MKTTNRIFGIAAALVFSFTNLLGSALADTPEATTTEEPGVHSAAVVIPPAEAAAGATTPASDTPAKHKYGEGMQIPVDGTSLAAFDLSLENIKAKTTRPEFTTLTNAIDYLMVYYIEAKRDRTKLAALLNGMTGEEIVALVKW